MWYARGDHIPVLGHRGIKAKYPENTMVSFKAVIDLGVDLIEFAAREKHRFLASGIFTK